MRRRERVRGSAPCVLGLLFVASSFWPYGVRGNEMVVADDENASEFQGAGRE